MITALTDVFMQMFLQFPTWLLSQSSFHYWVIQYKRHRDTQDIRLHMNVLYKGRERKQLCVSHKDTLVEIHPTPVGSSLSCSPHSAVSSSPRTTVLHKPRLVSQIVDSCEEPSQAARCEKWLSAAFKLFKVWHWLNFEWEFKLDHGSLKSVTMQQPSPLRDL